MAHELGHYFGLDHENGEPTNLMCQSSKAKKLPSGLIDPAAVKLNPDQVEFLKTEFPPVWIVYKRMKEAC
jgi:hypothetical protein